MTPVRNRAQELLNSWDSLRTSRSCIHIIDILEHKDNLEHMANLIRLGLCAMPDIGLDQVCNRFELEYTKVKDKIHNDLIAGLGTK